MCVCFQTPTSSAPNEASATEEGDAPHLPPPPALPPPPTAPTFFVPMPTLTPTSVANLHAAAASSAAFQAAPAAAFQAATSGAFQASTSAAFPPGIVGAPGLSMAALGALQLAPILVSSSSASSSAAAAAAAAAASTSPHLSTSPETEVDGDEGRLVINEDDHDFEDAKNTKGLK